MILFSENELLMIALILDEKEKELIKKKKNGYGFIRHGRRGQHKGNIEGVDG